jgi:hypothetical protein
VLQIGKNDHRLYEMTRADSMAGMLGVDPVCPAPHTRSSVEALETLDLESGAQRPASKKKTATHTDLFSWVWQARGPAWCDLHPHEAVDDGSLRTPLLLG